MFNIVFKHISLMVYSTAKYELFRACNRHNFFYRWMVRAGKIGKNAFTYMYMYK